MNINTAFLELKTDKLIKQDASKLRGYFGNTFKEYPLLHNHYGDNKVLYSYPLIQYQVLNGKASLVGIEEGVNVLKAIASDITELKLDDSYYRVEEKILHEKDFNISTSNEEYHYKFLSPWLALNTKNYSKYKNIDNWKDKKLFLNKILIGNILSMSKGLGIIVNRRIYVKSHLEEIIVNYKGIPMTGFTGEFKVKFKIPDYFGFGKGVSQGFGTVCQIVDEEKAE